MRTRLMLVGGVWTRIVANDKQDQEVPQEAAAP